MPVGGLWASLWLKISRWTNNPELVEEAQREVDAYQTGQLRRAERQYGYRLAQLEGFYLYHCPPRLPDGITEEEAWYGVPKEKCDWAFRAIDHCLYIWRERDRGNTQTFHTRLYSCHADWENYMRCVSSRDVHILRNIERWEKRHMKRLEDHNAREAYVKKLAEETRYYEYLFTITDPDKKMSCYYEKRCKEFRRRLDRLVSVFRSLENRNPAVDLPTSKLPKVTQTTDLGRGHYSILLR